MLDRHKNHVVIIDYGIGNLLSVRRAVEVCGAIPMVTSCPNKISNAERLILPGVGAFSTGMSGLKKQSLIEPIKDYVLKSFDEIVLNENSEEKWFALFYSFILSENKDISGSPEEFSTAFNKESCCVLLNL